MQKDKRNDHGRTSKSTVLLNKHRGYLGPGHPPGATKVSHKRRQTHGTKTTTGTIPELTPGWGQLLCPEVCMSPASVGTVLRAIRAPGPPEGPSLCPSCPQALPPRLCAVPPVLLRAERFLLWSLWALSPSPDEQSPQPGPSRGVAESRCHSERLEPAKPCPWASPAHPLKPLFQLLLPHHGAFSPGLGLHFPSCS